MAPGRARLRRLRRPGGASVGKWLTEGYGTLTSGVPELSGCSRGPWGSSISPETEVEYEHGVEGDGDGRPVRRRGCRRGRAHRGPPGPAADGRLHVADPRGADRPLPSDRGEPRHRQPPHLGLLPGSLARRRSGSTRRSSRYLSTRVSTSRSTSTTRAARCATSNWARSRAPPATWPPSTASSSGSSTPTSATVSATPSPSRARHQRPARTASTGTPTSAARRRAPRTRHTT